MKLFSSIGDQCSRAGLPTAPTYGLPYCLASTYARLLGERKKLETQVLPDRQYFGQTYSQCRQP